MQEVYDALGTGMLGRQESVLAATVERALREGLLARPAAGEACITEKGRDAAC